MCPMRQEKGKITLPKVIFEDEIILVIDKPAGLVVNRSETTQKVPTLQEWLENNFKFSIFNFQSCRSGIVHRLDKGTSGIIVIAKTKEAFDNLQRQFKERQVEKKYLALAHGKIEPPNGTIRASVSRSPFNRKKFGVFLGGREAETDYTTITNYKLQITNEIFSFLELKPKTGRTHQIRVHLKHIGHPVVGDEVYAGRKTYQADRKWCPRQFLHAAFLSFTHPQTNKTIKFSSPLPADLKEALAELAGHLAGHLAGA